MLQTPAHHTKDQRNWVLTGDIHPHKPKETPSPNSSPKTFAMLPPSKQGPCMEKETTQHDGECAKGSLQKKKKKKETSPTPTCHFLLPPAHSGGKNKHHTNEGCQSGVGNSPHLTSQRTTTAHSCRLEQQRRQERQQSDKRKYVVCIRRVRYPYQPTPSTPPEPPTPSPSQSPSQNQTKRGIRLRRRTNKI